MSSFPVIRHKKDMLHLFAEGSYRRLSQDTWKVHSHSMTTESPRELQELKGSQGTRTTQCVATINRHSLQLFEGDVPEGFLVSCEQRPVLRFLSLEEAPDRASLILHLQIRQLP